MPTARLGVLLPLLLVLAACGRDKPSHGLERTGFESAPEGDALDVGFVVTDGEAYSADVAMDMTVRHVVTTDGRPKTTERSGRAVLEMVWTLRKPRPEAAPTSVVSVRYAEAQGANAEAYLDRAPIVGSLQHDDDGRVQPRSLQLQGGKPDEQLQMQDLLVGMMLAGFAGSYPWTPPEPIRVGETWPLEAFIKPRALDNVRRYARETGLGVPEPTFEGTGILRGIVEEDGERWLEVEIEALIQIQGVVSKGTERGRVALGDRLTGTASISASRGVPRRFEVTHVRRTQSRGGSSESDLDIRSTLRGTVVHTLPAK